MASGFLFVHIPEAHRCAEARHAAAFAVDVLVFVQIAAERNQVPMEFWKPSGPRIVNPCLTVSPVQ